MESVPPKYRVFSQQLDNFRTHLDQMWEENGIVISELVKLFDDAMNQYQGPQHREHVPLVPAMLSAVSFILMTMFDVTDMKYALNEIDKYTGNGVLSFVKAHLPSSSILAYSSRPVGRPSKSYASLSKELTRKQNTEDKQESRKRQRDEDSKKVNSDYRVFGRAVFNSIVNGDDNHNIDSWYIQNVSQSSQQPARFSFARSLFDKTFSCLSEHYNDVVIMNKNQSLKRDLEDGFSDFVLSLVNCNKLSHNLIKEFKFGVVKEYVDQVRQENFTPYKIVKLMDTNLGFNSTIFVKLRQLLNFKVKSEHMTWTDVVSDNGTKSGGDHSSKLQMISSHNDCFKYSNCIERTGLKLMGATVADKKAAASISVKRFMELYLKELVFNSVPTDFDDNNHYRYPICLDITNDGTNYSSCSLNIAGIKIYPMDTSMDEDTALKKTVILPLSVFVAPDKTENLAAYHFPNLYFFFQKELGMDGKLKVVGDNGQPYSFNIDYCFSGDMKSHAQLCGMRSMAGTSMANFMYCCTDCHKTKQLGTTTEICDMCKSKNRTYCRHKPMIKAAFQYPSPYSKWQNILDCIKQERIQKCAENEQYHLKSYSEIHGERTSGIMFIDYNFLKSNQHSKIKQNIFGRLLEFKQVFKSKISLEQLIFPSKRIILEIVAEGSSDFINLNDADEKSLMYYLRIRFCHSAKDMQKYTTSQAIIALVTNVLKESYNYDCTSDIEQHALMINKLRSLVRMMILTEESVLHAYTEASSHIKPCMVMNRIRLIVCLLHMEMRIGLFMVQELLNSCIIKVYKQEFANKCIESLEYYLNSQVFRSSTSDVGNYKFPRTKDKEIDTLTFSDKKLRMILKASDSFIDRIFNFETEAEREKGLQEVDDLEDHMHTNSKETWKTMFSGFKNIMETLSSFSSTSTDDQYKAWQFDIVDPWITLFLDHFSWDRCGYYVHFLARGHLLEQLIEVRNIHKHSQQSWEGLMGTIKRYLATHTQRGGGKHKGSQQTFAIVILRLMLRNAMFALYPKEERLEAVLANADIMQECNRFEGYETLTTDSNSVDNKIKELYQDIVADVDSAENILCANNFSETSIHFSIVAGVDPN